MILWFKNTCSFWTGLLELKIICHGSHLQPVWQVTDGKIFLSSFKDCLAFCMIGWHSKRIFIHRLKMTVDFSTVILSYNRTVSIWKFDFFLTRFGILCRGQIATYFMIKGGFDFWRKLDTLLMSFNVTLFHQFCTFLSFFIIERIILGISMIWNKTGHTLLYIRFPKVFNDCC